VTNEQPELDRIIAALRSAAHSSELGGEDAAVDAMASTLASTPATVHSVGSPRSLRVVAVVAASLIGMGGIAAAGAATFGPAQDRNEIRAADTVVDATTPDTAAADNAITDDTITDDTITDDAITDDAVTDDAITDDTGAELVDDPTTAFDETQCAEGNHGATVSSIAKETPSGPDHGDAVSEAAQSSCGKDVDDTATDDTITDDTGAELVDDPTTAFDETQCAEGNHGATVSSIAKETPSGPDHGDAVSEAAQSSCGKSTAADDTAETTVGSTTDDDSAGNRAGNGNGNGNGNGHGRGTGGSGG
jgi:hypothetical protein